MNRAPKSLVLFDIDGTICPISTKADANLPNQFPIAEHTIELLKWLQEPATQTLLNVEPLIHSTWHPAGGDITGAEFFDDIGMEPLNHFASDAQFLNHDRDHQLHANWKIDAIADWLNDPANEHAVIFWFEDEVTRNIFKRLNKLVSKSVRPRLIVIRTQTQEGITKAQATLLKAYLNI